MNDSRRVSSALVLFPLALTVIGCISLGVIMLTFGLSPVCVASESKSAFSDFQLPSSPTAEDKTYLGLTGKGDFKASEIKANVLIIEIFSKVCPHCHKEAPKLNELYQAIEQKPELKGRIKIIGLAAGNTDSEVAEYKEQHKVPFPLFPDKYLRVIGPMGVMTTPTFIGVKINKNKTLEQIYFQKATFGETPEFLAQVLKLSGLKKEE